jgi:hypothetical protein
MASNLDLGEDDLHAKRITFDTAEWHRRLEELAKLRQPERLICPGPTERRRRAPRDE